jgi:hypothetical protein
MYVYRNTDTLSRKQFWHGKAMSVTYSACVSVALFVQHALRMRRMILASLASLAVQYFSILPHKRHDFRKNVIEYNVYFDCLYKLV